MLYQDLAGKFLKKIIVLIKIATANKIVQVYFLKTCG